MSQTELKEYIEQQPDKWFTAKELSKKTGLRQNTIYTSLKKLRMWNRVNYKRQKQTKRSYQFVYQAKEE